MKLGLICSGILAFFQIAQAASASGASAMGKQIFMNNCVTCHGVTGKGIPQPEAPEIPDLRSAKVQQLSDADLAAIISNGQKSMPAWKGVLSPAEIGSTVKFLRTLSVAKRSSK
jgi:mono/diheme cytochrome c family protein